MRLVPVPGVFKPHSDSLMLADQLRHHQPAGASVLDMCTGSGVLAITAALCGAESATAVDISRRSVIAVRINAKLNGVRVRAIRGSLFSPVHGERFDLITSNPPYLPSTSDELPDRGSSRAWEAGLRGRQFIDRICIDAPRYLRPHGTLLLVHSSICSEHATVEALQSQGFQVQVVARSHGPLGPRVRARAELLRARGLLSDSDVEEILIFRAALA
jgi:release factor glutamine methyltransferase